MNGTSLALLGAEVRRRREELGWTQTELAERSGMHRNYIRSIEQGQRNISLRNLLALADAFHVDLLELLGPVVRPDSS